MQAATLPKQILMSQEAAIADINERKLLVQTKTAALGYTKMESLVRISQVVCDLLMAFLSCSISYYIHFNYGPGADEARDAQLVFSYAQISLIVPFLVLFWHWTQGLYQGSTHSRMEEGTRVLKATSLIMLTLLSLLFFYRDYSYSRNFMFLLAIFIPLMTGGARTFLSTLVNFLHARGYGNRRVIFVGSGEHARFVYGKLLRDPEAGYTAVGYLKSNGQDELKHLLPFLGKLENFARILKNKEVDEVIVALPADHQQDCQRVISEAVAGGVAIRLLPDVYQYIPEAISLEVIRGVHVLSPRRTPIQGLNAMCKRGVDFVLATILLVAFSPIFLALALLIYLEDRGPVVYSQVRVGKNGRHFKILKFRSMKVGAESQSGPVWAQENDPRVTRVGKWLRHLSLDELPQFWNVLRGDMSFIGPRPERPAFVKEFEGQVSRYAERHDVKPGISGWAQVNGLRGNTSIQERTRYDLFYKDHWSWTLELRIYFQTLLELILRRNAY